MKKITNRVLTILLVCCMLMGCLCITASAASASVHFSDPSVTVGSNVSVSVSIGEAVAMYDIYLSYDSSMLEYVSSSGSGNFSGQGGGGSVHINDYAGSGAGSFSCTLTFKALKSGSARINVASTDVVDGNGDDMSVTCGYSVVTINNPKTASSDASLKSLSISPGTLSPSFSSGTTSYTATVSASTTSVAVSASKNHSGASVSVSGTDNLKVGKNNVTITVTAEDGTQKTYTIVVTRPASTVKPPDNSGTTTEKPDDQPAEEPETPKEAYATTVTGETLKVDNEIPEDVIPAGFETTETTVESVTVPAIVFKSGGKIYVFLTDENGENGRFYCIDEKTGLASPMETLSQTGEKLIVSEIDASEAPAGYKTTKYKIGEAEYDAFVPEKAGEFEFCLIYAVNEKGERVLYAYDPAEGSFQRYGLTELSVTEPEPAPEPEPTPEPEPEPEKTESKGFVDMLFGNKVLFWCVIAAAIVIVLLIILAIMLGIMYSRKARACRLMASGRSHESVPWEPVDGIR